MTTIQVIAFGIMLVMIVTFFVWVAVLVVKR